MISTVNLNTEPAFAAKDLRHYVSESELLQFCLEAVQALNLSPEEVKRTTVDDFRPQMLLTLLTFAYACRSYGSEDIEWSTHHDRTMRYICARTFPQARTLRQFRRQYRPLIERCLQDVLERAWRTAFCPVKTDYAFHSWLESRLHAVAALAARQRLQFAVMSDTVAFDW